MRRVAQSPARRRLDWDGPAAQKAVFDACGFDGDKPDLAKARKAFLAYDASDPKKRGSYKLPFATIKDGRMTAVAAGIRAAASRLSQTDIPDDVQKSARAVIDEYEGKMTKENDKRAGLVTKRGLYAVSNLAYLLAMAGSIKSDVDYEEAAEGDAASPNPENMLAVLQALGKALVDMAVEEVAELLAGFDPVDAAGAERALAAMAFTRAGKKLAKADKEDLEDVHAHAQRSARLVARARSTNIPAATKTFPTTTRARRCSTAPRRSTTIAPARPNSCAPTSTAAPRRKTTPAPWRRNPSGDGDGEGDDARAAARTADEQRKQAAARKSRERLIDRVA